MSRPDLRVIIYGQFAEKMIEDDLISPGSKYPCRSSSFSKYLYWTICSLKFFKVIETGTSFQVADSSVTRVFALALESNVFAAFGLAKIKHFLSETMTHLR